MRGVVHTESAYAAKRSNAGDSANAAPRFFCTKNLIANTVFSSRIARKTKSF